MDDPSENYDNEPIEEADDPREEVNNIEVDSDDEDDLPEFAND
jgi:hypothetical protein